MFTNSTRIIYIIIIYSIYCKNRFLFCSVRRKRRTDIAAAEKMKKVAIVYSSKYGHTKQYADWLVEDIGDSDVIEIGKFNITQMMAYKLVIFACGVYSDKMAIMEYVKKNISAIPVQKTMIMAVSWYTNGSAEGKEKLIAENYPEQFKGSVPLYVVNSGINKKQISKVDSMKLIAAQVSIEKKDGRSSDDINMLAIIKGYSDQTARENLDGIKKGIEEFFNPPKAPEPAKPKAAAPKPSAASKPAAPKPAAAAPKPAAAAPKPAPAAKPAAAEDALSSSVEEAFKNLGAPKPKPAAEPVQPAAEVPEDTGDPVIKFNANGKVVVSSVLDAINSLNNPREAAPEPVAAPRPAADEAEPEKKMSAAAAEEAAASAEETVPAAEHAASAIEKAASALEEAVAAAELAAAVEAQAEASEEAQSADDRRANSYMELFAKRKRGLEESAAAVPGKAEEASSEAVSEAASEAVSGAAPAPAPAPAPIPRPKPARDISVTDLDIGDLDFDAVHTPAPAPTPASAPTPAPAASGEPDLDGYDFISDSKPSASSRALNAVQDLAKAKAEAEREAAKLAAARHAELVEEEPEEQESAYEEESDDGIIVVSEDHSYDEESGSDSDGLEAFDFTTDFDYDVNSEIQIEQEKAEVVPDIPRDSSNNIDIAKLQEEINASIESNRAAKERMMSRQGKKKEEHHNPFAVQFDEEEEGDKKKKKKKSSKPEPKRLDDPIDPDIFFGKNTAKVTDFNTGTMPEIKFRNLK